jgi:hypothetical protein
MAEQPGRDGYGYRSNPHMEAAVLCEDYLQVTIRSLARLEASEHKCYDAGIRV